MNNRPTAISSFEGERDTMDQFASIAMEHPLERLKYHIQQTGGKILKSEFAMDGTAYVLWESQGKKFRAWSTWPDQDSTVNWKQI